MVVLEKGVKRIMPQSPVVRRIRRAAPDEASTLVVKQGGRLPLKLVLVEAVTIGEVRAYCHGQCGWELAGLGVAVNGRHYQAGSDEIVLDPTPQTERIEFGTFAETVTVEFRRKTDGKG